MDPLDRKLLQAEIGFLSKSLVGQVPVLLGAVTTLEKQLAACKSAMRTAHITLGVLLPDVLDDDGADEVADTMQELKELLDAPKEPVDANDYRTTGWLGDQLQQAAIELANKPASERVPSLREPTVNCSHSAASARDVSMLKEIDVVERRMKNDARNVSYMLTIIGERRESLQATCIADCAQRLMQARLHAPDLIEDCEDNMKRALEGWRS